MIKSKSLLETEISNALTLISNKRREIQKLNKEAVSKYGIPQKIVDDYTAKRKDLTDASPFVLFILTDVLLGQKKLVEYFTPIEIKSLSKEKWNTETLEFPLRFSVRRITDDQYVGGTSVKELMLFRDAQFINYNENAQRTMQHIVKGDVEYYKIALNKNAVNAIVESFDNDVYIPNTITLNIPEDASYDYDEKKQILIIHEAKYLDILDGYHRYVAMSMKHNEDPDWDRPMELRIVQFDESKARRFIWQEDQKTKMRKIDSESMNSNKVANRIVERINGDNRFILYGKISRNKGIINAAYFGNIIERIYLKGIKKSEEFKAMKTIANQLIQTIEDFTDMYPQYLSRSWTKHEIYMMCYEAKFGNLKNFSKDLRKVIKDGGIYKQPSLEKADITRTHKLLGKEGY